MPQNAFSKDFSKDSSSYHFRYASEIRPRNSAGILHGLLQEFLHVFLPFRYLYKQFCMNSSTNINMISSESFSSKFPSKDTIPKDFFLTEIRIIIQKCLQVFSLDFSRIFFKLFFSICIQEPSQVFSRKFYQKILRTFFWRFICGILRNISRGFLQGLLRMNLELSLEFLPDFFFQWRFINFSKNSLLLELVITPEYIAWHIFSFHFFRKFSRISSRQCSPRAHFSS